ncbi:MAG: fluoride efflux transporter CrcB [Gammaproteobacteria bacterium]|nr:fluoride efflux transporter CrcB [Gammaproteobacteria bacterium]
MMFYLALIVAGGSGALLRYLLSGGGLNLNAAVLPYGTLLVNVLGSFLIGFLAWQLSHRWQVSRELQIIVLTGFLGGFTTFSAFSLETIELIEDGHLLRAVTYVAGSVFLSIAMCLAGLWLARQS